MRPLLFKIDFLNYTIKTLKMISKSEKMKIKTSPPPP